MPALCMIANYFFQQKQRVKISKIKIEWEEIDKDVPQGSISRTLIFNSFKNDLFTSQK